MELPKIHLEQLELEQTVIPNSSKKQDINEIRY